MKSYESLESIFEKSAHLEHAIAMLQWDEATTMPAGGASIRAHSLATLTGLQQSLLASHDHLDAIRTASACHALTDWQRANLQLMERDILKRLAVPTDLVEALTRASIETERCDDTFPDSAISCACCTDAAASISAAEARVENMVRDRVPPSVSSVARDRSAQRDE